MARLRLRLGLGLLTSRDRQRPTFHVVAIEHHVVRRPPPEREPADAIAAGLTVRSSRRGPANGHRSGTGRRRWSNKEIAADLHVGEQTVKTHVSSLLGRLQVEDRTQAASYAIRRGLVPVKDAGPGTAWPGPWPGHAALAGAVVSPAQGPWPSAPPSPVSRA